MATPVLDTKTTLLDDGGLLSVPTCLVGEHQQRFDEAASIRALVAVMTAIGHNPRLNGAFRNVEGATLWRMGKYVEARDGFEQALAIYEKASAPHLVIAATPTHLGLVLTDMDDYPARTAPARAPSRPRPGPATSASATARGWSAPSAGSRITLSPIDPREKVHRPRKKSVSPGSDSDNFQGRAVREGDLVAGRYRLLRRIGAGAMGTVWAARHELLGRDLALKICAVGQREGASFRAARDLFLREAGIVGRLRHPNVVDIADAGDAGRDGLYLAMELLEGESLADHIAAAPLSPTDALAVAAEICRGLVAAHAAGVIHRDLKPENVFLARGPAGGVVPKLLDFGVSSAAGLTIPPSSSGGSAPRREELFGTPAYMSPEQALGEGDIDPRTDLWALGVVLYEMLTGRLPFEAESYPALLPKIIERPHPPLPAAIPAEVRTVVAGCLAKDRRDRYPSADALLQAVERALTAIHAPEPVSVRSGFFVEMGRGMAPSSPPYASFASTTRGARLGLALAILALPVAIGIAAVATRAQRGSAGTDARPSQAAPPPPLPPAAEPPPAPPPPVTVPGPSASVSATPPSASCAAPRRSIRGPKWKVTSVDNAGF